MYNAFGGAFYPTRPFAPPLSSPMPVPLLNSLSPRLRVLVPALVALLSLAAAGALYVVPTFLTPAPPAFQPRHAVPHTDVNPYGANFFLEREVEAWKRERTVQMAREAGIGWARQEFVWAEIEPEPSKFNWTKYDGIVDLLLQNHIRVIARLDGPPSWARLRASGTGSSGPPDDPETYGSFVRAFAEHYRGKVYHLQIWNEPNLAREWNDAPIDPAGYTRLLSIAYREAKSVDPNILILSAPLAITLGESFAPDSTQYRNMNDLQFLEDMYAARAKDSFDILSANAFGLGSPPDDPPNPGKLNFQRVVLERDVMKKFADENKPVWILEYGWNAAPDRIPDSRLVWGRVTEEQQAQYTVQGIGLARANWDWVGVLSIWYFRQVGNIPPSNPEAYFRMVDVDFTPRPVYFSVAAATQSLDVAGPGEFEETHPALTLHGDWQYVIDSNASGGQFIQTADPAATATLKFYGDGLDLVLARAPGAGRIFVTLDGRPVNGLLHDESGQSYVEQAGTQAEWQAQVVVARDLAQSEHVAELRVEGRANLDGFRIPPIVAPSPNWPVVGFLGLVGVTALALAWNQVRGEQKVERG